MKSCLVIFFLFFCVCLLTNWALSYWRSQRFMTRFFFILDLWFCFINIFYSFVVILYNMLGMVTTTFFACRDLVCASLCIFEDPLSMNINLSSTYFQIFNWPKEYFYTVFSILFIISTCNYCGNKEAWIL